MMPTPRQALERVAASRTFLQDGDHQLADDVLQDLETDLEQLAALADQVTAALEATGFAAAGRMRTGGGQWAAVPQLLEQLAAG